MEASEIKKNQECGCLKAHGYKKDTVFNSETGLACFMPAGIKALFLGDNQTLKAKLSRTYRLYALDDLCAPDNVKADLSRCKTNVFCRDFKKERKKMFLPEDLRLVISEGGFNSFGKYLAREMNKHGAPVKHLMCGGGNLSCFDYVLGGTSVAKRTNQPVGGIIGGGAYTLKKFGIATILEDFESVNVPSAFAFVISTYSALFDWDISALLFGGRACGHIFLEAQTILQKLLESARTLPKKSAQLKKDVFFAALSISALIETAGPILLQSGAYQAAAAFNMLLSHEQRPIIDLFEAGFLLSPFVAKTYAAFLEDLPFSFPPDNGLHSARLSEYLGINELESITLPPPYFDIKTLQLADYRLRIYREDLLRQVYDLICLHKEAQPMYLKLFEDDGFGLKDFLNPADVSLSLALGSDVLHGDTLLHYIRGRGLLDKYIQ